MVAWLCVAYLILPTRWIVPDSLPFGMIDDVIVAIIGALVLIRFSPQEVIDEAKSILDVEKVIASIFLVDDLRIQKN